MSARPSSSTIPIPTAAHPSLLYSFSESPQHSQTLSLRVTSPPPPPPPGNPPSPPISPIAHASGSHPESSYVPQPLPATKAPEVIEDVESIFPPSAFGIVEDKVFRCNAFEPANFSFVELLELKSVIYLSPEIPHRALKEFLSLHNVQFFHQGLKVWKPEITWKPVSEEIVKDTLEFVLNSQNHPVMIMGSSGINETGTVVGCLRRLQGWNLTSIIDEYRRFSGSKGKNVNELFIEMFDVTRISLPSSGNLPSWFLNNLGYSEKEKEMLERGIMISDLQKTYFDVYKCPLISEKVKYDKKKSICNDED